MEKHGHILSSFFPCIVLSTGNLWGNQAVRFICVIRIDKFCHAMCIMDDKYTGRITLRLGTEVGMFPLFVLTCLVTLLCNVR